MQHTMSYSVGGRVFDLPSDKVQGFLETAKANGDAPEEAYSYRVSGKDGGSREFTIPRSKYEGFKQTADANGDTVEPLRTMTMADGSRRSFTMGEMSKFLRSKEYRESEDYTPPQIGSVAGAAVKGALGGAAEGAYYGGKNALAKVATALPEAAASVGEAVGNTINLGGNAKNAVGDWLRASGQQTKRWLGENIRGDRYDENGNLVMSGLTKDLGYEDALTKIGETAGDAAAMAVKFAPAAVAGPAYMETILASDGINAYADTFDRAKAAGYSVADANLAGAASGLINYYGAKLMMKGGAATKDIANPLLRALAGTAFTGAATAAQAVGNKGVENAIEGKTTTEGMLGAAGEGFVEGAQFHLINEVGTNAKQSMAIRRETREMKEMRKENLLTAAETPEGRAFLNTVVQNEGVDAAVKARKEGKDISRKMGAAADLPDNMSAAERNAVIDGISKAREAQAERVRTKMDDVQAQSLADEIGQNLMGGATDPMFEDIWLNATRRVKNAAELDEPGARARIVGEAIEDVVGKQLDAGPANRTDTPLEKKIAQNRSRIGQEQKAQRKAELDEYERAEQERIAREKAEQDAQMAEDERARAGEIIASGTEANVPIRESSEYKSWLRKNGRTDTDKNFNRYVAERGLDESLKVERGHNGPNEETKAELEMGRRIEAQGEAQRANEQSKYDEEMTRREEAKAKAARAAKEKQVAEDWAAAEADRKAKAQEASRKGQEERARRKNEMAEYEFGEEVRKAQEAAEERGGKPRISVGEGDVVPPSADSRMKDYPEYASWIKKQGRVNNDKNWNKWVLSNGLDPRLTVERNRGSKIPEKPVRPDSEASAPTKPTPPELRVEKPQKPVVEADLSDMSKKTAQVGKETPENAEIGATKAGETDKRDLSHSAHLDIYTPGDAPGGVEGARIVELVHGKTGEKQFQIVLKNGESIDVGPVGKNGKFGIRKGDDIRGPFDTLGNAVQKANELYGREKKPTKVPDGRGRMVEKKTNGIGEDIQAGESEIKHNTELFDNLKKGEVIRVNTKYGTVFVRKIPVEDERGFKIESRGMDSNEWYSSALGKDDIVGYSGLKKYKESIFDEISKEVDRLEGESDHFDAMFRKRTGKIKWKDNVGRIDTEEVISRNEISDENAPSRAPSEKGTTSRAKGAEGAEARNGDPLAKRDALLKAVVKERERISAKGDGATQQEKDHLRDMANEYQGYQDIIAAKGLGKKAIFDAFKQRIVSNDSSNENRVLRAPAEKGAQQALKDIGYEPIYDGDMVVGVKKVRKPSTRAPQETQPTSQAKGAEGKETRNGANGVTVGSMTERTTSKGRIVDSVIKVNDDGSVVIREQTFRKNGEKPYRETDKTYSAEEAERIIGDKTPTTTKSVRVPDGRGRMVKKTENPAQTAKADGEAETKMSRPEAEVAIRKWLDGDDTVNINDAVAAIGDYTEAEGVVNSLINSNTKRSTKETNLLSKYIKTMRGKETLADNRGSFAGRQKTVPEIRKRFDAERDAAMKPLDDALREIANGEEGSAKNWDDAKRIRFDELLGKGKLTKDEMDELAILVGGPNGSRESIEVPLGKTGSLKVRKSTREIIQARQNLRGLGGNASKRYYEIDTATPAQKLADPDFKAWAQKQGRTPTDGARRIYDAQRVDAVFAVAKNWLKGVKMRRTENAAEVPQGARMLYSRDGNVVGWYDRAKKEVVTLPGADAATVAHELGWHATYEYAQTEAAAGRTALLDKLTEYANNAPQSVKNEILRKYGMATDAATLLDEIGAARYTMDNVNKIKDAATRRQTAKWYQRTWNAIADTYKAMLSKMGWNKARLDNLSALTPEETVNLLADEMLKGRTLGKAKSSQIDMSKGETIVQLHDRKLKDRLRPIEEIEKEAGKSVENSAHTLFRNLPGKVQGAIDKAQNFADKVKADCKKAGIKIDELNEFLYASAASERNAKVLARNGRLDGSAMSHADIQRILSAYRNSPKYAELRRIADDVLAFQRNGFDFRRKSGLISDETWNTLLADEPNHVPMKSRFDPNGEHMGFSLTEQFGKPEWKTAEGRTNVGDGPLEWIVQEYVDAFSRGHENTARRALLETVLAHPEIGEVKKLGPNDALGEVKRKGQQGDPNVFIVKTDGDTYQVKLNGTRGELIARAVSGRGLMRMDWTNAKIPHTEISVRNAMRWWSATATSWSPTFAGRNFLADTMDVFAVNVGENGLIKGTGKFGKHVYTALKLTNAIRKYASTGETTDPLIREAVDAGVLMGGGVRGQAFADAGEAALKTLKTDWGNGRNRVKAVRNAMFGWIDTLNQTAELMNRMADYKLQREAGKGKNEAALHAREITVDFNEKGEVTPVTNMLYMFSNSMLGATMRLNKAIFASKEGKSLAAGMFAMGLIEGMAEALSNGDDEDGKNMNEYTRANSFYFRNGKDIYRIPLHASPISVIKYAGNCTARKLFGTLRGDKAAEQVAKDMIGMMTSYLGIGALGDNEAASIAPTIVQPFIQAYMNRDFADRPIERTSFSEEKPKSGNGRPSTPQFYKDLATWLNEFGGGNAGRKGELNVLGEKIGTDFSPEMLKHFAEATGKNALRDIENTVEFAKMVLGKTDWERRNIPVGRDYFRTTGGNDNRFFEAVRAYKTDAEDFKQRTGADKSDFRKAHPWLRKGNDGKTTVNRLINMTNRDNPRSGVASMGITQLRKLTEGKVRRKDGTYFEPKTPVSDEVKEKAKEWLQKRQARVIEIMGK